MGWFVHGILLIMQLYGLLALPVLNTAEDHPGMSMNQIMHYFHKYRYMTMDMPDSAIGEINSNMTVAVQEATRLFQKHNEQYGLQVTGELDDPTMALIQLPRCGVPDIRPGENQAAKRKRRYVLAGGKWNTNVLTYKILVYPQDRDMTVNQVDREIARAFKVWQDVTPLKFVRLERTDRQQAVIDIKFVPSYVNHGDGQHNAFDGPSGTLAHAFFPQGQLQGLAGDSHFDEAETWTLHTSRGTNLFQVAAHEFGHALGLEHSKDPSALMAPYYRGYIPNFKLPADDIRGIQALYGGPQAKPSPGLKFVCDSGSFDAITTIQDGNKPMTFAFKGKYYFQLGNNGIINSYPRLIKDEWPQLPNNIDAALFLPAKYSTEWDASKQRRVRVQTSPAVTFIFKGYQYWRINAMKVERGYPKRISDWGLPAYINSAFFNKRDGKIYFTKGNKYYIYKEGTGLVSSGRSLSTLRGLPSRVDAAIPGTNGITYFFRGPQYYAYNHATNNVERGFPKSNKLWTQCHHLQKQKRKP